MIYYIVDSNTVVTKSSIMEIRELRSFCIAAKLRSISKAAEYLDIGQPAVTTHVKKLEDELGTALFDRVKRPIQLTLAGTTLFNLATPLVEGIDGLVLGVSKAEEEGPVRVASTFDIIPHALLRVVKAFLSLYPHTHLRVRSGNWRQVLQMVAEGEVDLGIVPGPGNGADFDFEGLFPYERVLITPLGHPLLRSPLTSLDEIAQWPLILRGQGTSTRTTLEEEFRRKGLSYEIVVELDSIDMIKAYVALGLGISVGPRMAIEPGDEQQLGIADLTTLLPVGKAGVVTLRGKSRSKPTQKFIEVLSKNFSPTTVTA